ncbi:PREDICTED: arylacetamide deacetylase-like 4 [Gekko japonicus]|uniref:Arylacetamide deacetylase-like 4 n=1 Tax=Gekko japonicus TaxID=146911 RepID=A0ABM1JUT9_GEKJA|nr:PREDICTED: arylacetamide deacetylase-like 4 [Gekko japonicus]
MPLIWNVLELIAAALLTPFFLLLGWALYYHFSTTEIPAGMRESQKIRFLHLALVMVYGLDYICWKMGLCHRFAIVRLAMDGIPPLGDPRVFTKNDFFEGIPVRIYHPKRASTGLQRGILFFHGGSGMMGSIDAYERFCRYIARESDSVLVSVGYRLAPENPYPSQFNDCQDAAVYFMKNSENYGVDPARIILCGDSFGGMLTAYVCQELKSRTDLPKARAQVLLYPVLQALDCNLPSYLQNSFFPLITRVQVLEMVTQYLDKPSSLIDIAVAGNTFPESTHMKYRKWVHSDLIPQKFRARNHNKAPPAPPKYDLLSLLGELHNRRLSPLLAEDSFLKGLPETFILTFEYDVLRDDGLLYKKRLEDNGVLVSWHHIEDGFHASPVMLHHWLITFSHCKTATDSVVNYVKEL